MERGKNSWKNWAFPEAKGKHGWLGRRRYMSKIKVSKNQVGSVGCSDQRAGFKGMEDSTGRQQPREKSELCVHPPGHPVGLY